MQHDYRGWHSDAAFHTLQVMHGLSSMSLWVRIPLTSVQQQQQSQSGESQKNSLSTAGATIHLSSSCSLVSGLLWEHNLYLICHPTIC